MSRAHPWHGVPIGEDFPEVVTAYIEVVPDDTVKYELDKYTGILKLDRPQKYSNTCPTLYGLVPQTYCGDRIGKFCSDRVERKGIEGDKDPLDICVLTEKNVSHGDVILRARPIGGLRMIDHGKADDKILAVMNQDSLYGDWDSIEDCPKAVLDRLMHYFLTYKQSPKSTESQTEIPHVYDREEAYKVMRLAYQDYIEFFSGVNFDSLEAD